MRTTLRSLRRCLVVPAVGASVMFIAPHARVTVVAQPAQPCALLTIEDIQPLAYRETIAAGVASSYAPTGYSACRYAWGAGIDRYALEVNIGEPSRMFAGLASDQIKQALQSIVVADTADMVVSDVGDAAIFRAESPAYVQATALIKGSVLQLSLSGLDARDKKGEVIALLKQAAAKF